MRGESLLRVSYGGETLEVFVMMLWNCLFLCGSFELPEEFEVLLRTRKMNFQILLEKVIYWNKRQVGTGCKNRLE